MLIYTQLTTSMHQWLQNIIMIKKSKRCDIHLTLIDQMREIAEIRRLWQLQEVITIPICYTNKIFNMNCANNICVHRQKQYEKYGCVVRTDGKSWHQAALPTMHRGLRAKRSRPMQSWYLYLHPADQSLSTYSTVNHSTMPTSWNSCTTTHH